MSSMGYKIYKVTNLINNKVYIGSTVDTIEQRFWEHTNDSKNRCKSYFHKAIRKYGEENFKIEYIFNVFIEEDMNYFEDLFMDLYNSLDNNVGYNLIYSNRGIGSREHISNFMKNDWIVNRESRIKSMIGVPNIGHKKLQEFNKSPEGREIRRTVIKRRWENGEMEENKEIMKKLWADPEKKALRIESMIKGSKKQPLCSVSIHTGVVSRYSSAHEAQRSGYVFSSMYRSINTLTPVNEELWFKDMGESDEFFISEALKIIGSFTPKIVRKVMSVDLKTGIKTVYSCISDVKLDGYEPKRINKVLNGERATVDKKTWSYID